MGMRLGSIQSGFLEPNAPAERLLRVRKLYVRNRLMEQSSMRDTKKCALFALAVTAVAAMASPAAAQTAAGSVRRLSLDEAVAMLKQEALPPDLKG